MKTEQESPFKDLSHEDFQLLFAGKSEHYWNSIKQMPGIDSSQHRAHYERLRREIGKEGREILDKI